MKEKLLISFSGGKTSAYMTKKIIDHMSDQYEIMVVFANTGKENEETLKFIYECEVNFRFKCHWVEAITNPVHGQGITAKEVTFETASRNGEPFEQMIKKHGLPNKSNPICTRELKERAIKSFARQQGWKKYYTAIGIRVDEIDRISPNHKKNRYIYPLAQNFPTTKLQINEFWEKMPFTLNISEHNGNCDCCWKKSLRKLITIGREDPSKFDWWNKMEKKYGKFIPPSRKKNEKIKLPITMYRQNRSATEILEMSKKPLPPPQIKMEFGLPVIDELDLPNGCEESCEAF